MANRRLGRRNLPAARLAPAGFHPTCRHFGAAQAAPRKYLKTNGHPLAKGDNRVLRGGSYFNNPQNCRACNRNNNHPDNRNNNIGFRVAFAPSSRAAGWRH
ncbi:MAG: hypothetical protein D6816_06795 [Bacteroidetes bacterium]|nr:MAG: hypothetical protein D6816_06795 [Bacteroidota bacterium]